MLTYFTPLVAAVEGERFRAQWKTILLVLLIGAGAYGYMNLNNGDTGELTPVLLELEPVTSTAPDPSVIYAVTGTNGADNGVQRLIDLMDEHDQPFYLSSREESAQGPMGFIGNDDVVLIKVNSQWDERGGTNTDLVRSLVEAIINHPDGWRGEIVIADNGQAQYGGAGQGGSLDWMKNNAQNQSQSMQDVADMYAE